MNIVGLLKLICWGALALGLALGLAFKAYGADSYDPVTNILKIPLVRVNDNYYSNVQVILGSIISVGSPLSRTLAYDIYDASTQQLLIPVVNSGSNTYFFVLASVKSVLSVGGDQNQALLLTAPVAYKKVVVPNGPLIDPLSSVGVPTSLPASSASATLKVWISDPRNPAIGLINSGLFITPTTPTTWTWYGPTIDGSMYLNLPDGTYVMSVVEPAGTSIFSRKQYSVNIQSGVAWVAGATANAQGVFAVTLVLNQTNASLKALQTSVTAQATVSPSSFTPSSPCQLIDQTTNGRTLSTQLSAGFPKVASRVSSFGRIRALVVPVDFADVQGVDNTLTFFSPIVQQVSKFYLAQSYGKLAFDFEIVPNWVRMPFSSTQFNMAAAVAAPGQQQESPIGRDAHGYAAAMITATDGPVDYSQYEEVYFLVPKEMPLSGVGWGPTELSANWTSTGMVLNAATGAAPMYHNEQNGIVGSTWKWMIHETGHTLGFYDEGYQNVSTLGDYSTMSFSWSNNAIELTSWDRYLQGWLPESQIACTPLSNLAQGPKTNTLSPVERQDSRLKAIMIPMSKSKILVIESRKSEGFDIISAVNEGVMVYTVDMTLSSQQGAYVMQKRVGTKLSSLEDGLLKANDQLVVAGVKVTVLSVSTGGDVVKIEAAP